MTDLDILSPNKRLILAFLEMLAHDARGAFLTYESPDYRQHNQMIGDGLDCVIALFEAVNQDTTRFELQDMIEEDDKVVIFASRRTANGKPLCVLVDMFRIADGRLAEHWDVAQRVTDLPFRTGELR